LRYEAKVEQEAGQLLIAVEIFLFNEQIILFIYLCAVFRALTAGQQLTTFNHQSKIFVGGKIDSSGKLARPFRGSLAGLVRFLLCRRGI